MPPSNKEQLRRDYLAKRRALPFSEILARSFRVTEAVKGGITIEAGKLYHLFLPIKEQNELNTYPLIEWIWSKGGRVVISRVEGVDLHHYLLTPQSLLTYNRWGILEPTPSTTPLKKALLNELKIIFVPLLVADKAGHRIGYGGGFYDRFLAQYPNAEKIGLSLFPIKRALPDLEAHDIPLDRVIY